jgi:integrase
MTNFLFSTGVRQNSLIHIKVNDIDFDNRVVTVRVTKNRKLLIVPLNLTMVNILCEFLKHRQYESTLVQNKSTDYMSSYASLKSAVESAIKQLVEMNQKH